MERLSDLPAHRAQNDVAHWKQEAITGLTANAPDRIEFFKSNPPRTLSHEAFDKAQELNSPTGYPAIKRDLHNRLLRLDEIVRGRAGPEGRDGGRRREFSPRDDQADLAKSCHELAAGIERWLKSFKSEESTRVEKLVHEFLDADPDLDPAEARRSAYTRYEKTWEHEYALRFSPEAKDLFQRAWEAGEIASEHEQLAVRPLAIQFEEVPKLFNEIAESLYGQAA